MLHADLLKPHVDLQRPHVDQQKPHVDQQKPHVDLFMLFTHSTERVNLASRYRAAVSQLLCNRK